MKAIMIMMDTLNRHMLKVYDAAGRAITPNIDRLARRSLVFDNHFIGSAPCMPARRDLMTGRINFLERGWGPIEPFDVTFPTLLREKGVFTHIATDHCHYAELGGEGYMQQYDTWDLIRGQETDVWASQVRDPQMPRAYLGQAQRQYQCNRQHFKTDADHPTPVPLRPPPNGCGITRVRITTFYRWRCLIPTSLLTVPRRLKPFTPIITRARSTSGPGTTR